MIIVALLGVGIYAGLYYLLKRAEPLVMAEQCSVSTTMGGLDLDIEQARISAVIAGVAAQRRLPERAVQIAYITAIQESKIFNLPYGDRDSVGVFQQRPSQGWGTKKQLLDTVYATRKFFAALEKVKGYRKMPLDEAAQAVQRSADGSAYADHQRDAEILSAAFTGRVPRAVQCVYPRPATPAPARVDAARRLLVRVLGEAGVRGDQTGERSTGAGLRIDAPTGRRGWLFASFAVAHAQQYGLSHVRYDGVTWRAAQGEDGWRADSAATSRRVEVAVAGLTAPVPASSAASSAATRRSRAAARS